MNASLQSVVLRAGLLGIAIVSAVATGSGRTVTLPSGSLVSVGPRSERGYYAVMPFDQVDMANGDLMLSFTDLVLAGDAGMDLRFSRSFSLQGTALPDRWGFSFVDVPILMKNPVDPSPNPWSPTLVMGDGSTRPLYSGVVSGYLVTTEFWRYHVSSRTLYLPNGWVATYEPSGNPTGGIMLVEVHDPFGNQITPTWDTSTARPWKPTSVAQTVSGTTRTVSFQYQGQNPRLPSTMTYGSRTWTYAYAETSDHSLIRVEPPLGRHWYFTSTFGLFDSNGNPIPSSLSSLHVMVPTGGTVTYDFGAITLQCA